MYVSPNALPFTSQSTMCTYTLRYDVCNNFSEIKVNYVIILIVMNDNEEECDNLKLTLATETRLLCW